MKRTYFKGLEIVRLAMAGVPRAEIVRQTGSDHRSVIVVLCHARKRGGLAIPKLPPGNKPWRRMQVAELVTQRLSPEEIATRLDMSLSHVRVQLAKLRGNGVIIPYKRPPSQAFRDAVRRRSEWDNRLVTRRSRA